MNNNFRITISGRFDGDSYLWRWTVDGGWSVDELLLLPVQRFVEGGGQVFGQEDLQSLAGCHWGVAGHGEGPGHGIDEDPQRGLDIGRLELEKVRIKHSLVGGKRGCLGTLTWREYFSTDVMAAS